MVFSLSIEVLAACGGVVFFLWRSDSSKLKSCIKKMPVRFRFDLHNTLDVDDEKAILPRYVLLRR